MLLGDTLDAAIDSEKRITTSGLVGPKIAVRTSATDEEDAPDPGDGGGTPAPTPCALLFGVVTTTTGAIVSVGPTVKLVKTGAFCTGSPSVLFRFANTPTLYCPFASGSVCGVNTIRSESTSTWLYARGTFPVPGMNWSTWKAERSRPRAGFPPTNTEPGSMSVPLWKNTTILPG